MPPIRSVGLIRQARTDPVPDDCGLKRAARRPIERLLLAGLMCAITIPAASASELGSHTLLGQEDGHGNSPAVTSPIDTSHAGSAFITFSAGYTSNTRAPTDSYGNTWTRLGDPVVYRGYNGQFDVKAFLAMPATGGPGHTVSIVKNGQPAGEITIPFIEVRNAGALVAIASNYPPTGDTVTSGNVTTTGPATLVAFWWGDAPGLTHSAVPDNGFSIIENFVDLPPDSAVQCVVAYRQVTQAGTYHVTWSQNPAEGAPLWLFAFQTEGNSDLIFAGGFDL